MTRGFGHATLSDLRVPPGNRLEQLAGDTDYQLAKAIAVPQARISAITN